MSLSICTVVVVCLVIAFVSEQMQASLAAGDIEGPPDGAGVAPADINYGDPPKRHETRRSGPGAQPTSRRPGVAITPLAHPNTKMSRRGSLRNSLPKKRMGLREPTTVATPQTTTATTTTTTTPTTTMTTSVTTTTASATSTPETISTVNATIAATDFDYNATMTTSRITLNSVDTTATDQTTTMTETLNQSFVPASREPTEVPHEALYCTASVGVVAMALPPDGVCNFIFFDSLYAGGRFTLTDDVPAYELWEFLRRARQTTRTEYGVGIAFERLLAFNKDIGQPAAKKFLVYLREVDIAGYGVLSINDVHLSTESVKLALLAVKAIAELADSQASSSNSLTVLGVQASDHRACFDVTAAMRATYTPDVLMVLTHSTLRYASSEDCVILPAGMSMNPQESASEHEPTHALFEAAQMVQCMEVNEITVEVALASTLKARRYRPLINNEYRVFGSCETSFFDQDASPVHLCDDKSKEYEGHLKTDLDDTVALTFDAQDRLLYTFDVRETNARKYCAVKDKNPSRVFSIAAYDVNYDQGPGACSGKFNTGNFSRVEHLRSLVDFLRETYTRTSAYYDCLRA